MDMQLKYIGHNIKYFRNLKGLTQDKVAETANISLSYYKSIESTNDDAPSLDTLMKICIALDIPIDFVVKDCGIELFSDYSNYLISNEIKNINPDEKKILSNVLLNVIDLLKD